MIHGIYRKIKIANKTLYIKPYDTRIELCLLELLSFSDYENDDYYECIVDQILSECVQNYDNSISKIEKIITLMYVRNITVGDEFNANITCPYCKRNINKKINLDDIVMLSSEVHDDITHQFINSNTFNVNLDDYNVDDWDINEYESVSEHLTDYFTLYNPEIKVTCQCGKQHIVNFFQYKTILNFLSDDTFISLSSCIRVIVMQNKYSRESVLDMTPVQRLIELKYIKEQIQKEQNEQIQSC